ncbi:hypothetical protein [Aliagarivorans marinus]|uniref:hypothetical protein n=1 Tax=Aliagarivorans marinus TaxID=561965 RepID=UPI000479FFA4|nr:hypothetical protein [Aliagarivorans marinus]
MLKHKLTIALSIGILAIMGFAAFMLYDEPLSDDARYLLSLVEEPRENDAYYLLIGLDTDKEQDPIAVGKACAHKQSDLCEFAKWDFEHALDDCPDNSTSCFLDSDLTGALEHYSVPLQRMKAFLASDDYSPVFPPDINRRTDVNWLLANQMVRLMVAQHLQAGSAVELEELLAQLRAHLVMTESSLAKVLILNWTAATLNALVELNASTQVEPLTDSERSFARVFAYDFASIYSSLNFVAMAQKEQLSNLNILSRLIYKERTTVNRLAKNYRALINNAWSRDDALEGDFRSSLSKFPWYEYLRNYIGVLLIKVATPYPIGLTSLELEMTQAIETLNRQR